MKLEREKARQRTRDALVRKARAGHVAGGTVFGYANQPVMAPSGEQRSHVERVVNPEEAAVVRRIFEMAAAGSGVRKIAITLNDEGAAAPVPRRAGRPRSWAPSSVREVLHRDLYRGLVTWGRIRKRDQWGRKRYLERPKVDWVTLARPDLRHGSDELWNSAHVRLERSRVAYLRSTGGQLHGRA